MTDKEWANIIKWLQKNNLVLHIPIKGKIYFTQKN